MPRFASHDSSSPAKSVEAAVRARVSELLRDTTTNTSQLVDLPLPANLSGAGGVRAWALCVRSNALWADGVNAMGFTIPPRVVPAPFARRLTILFKRFVGNSTVAFAAPRRYALAAPVAGLLAYDASAGPDAQVSLRLLRSSPRLHFGVLGAT
ncbi:uncharacterized protein [Miscanthus floridulus]|uniref:uncharacterized protein n=1 Tax=Miscanthus floridulus TaxID=154761 RepID=UPI0034594212